MIWRFDYANTCTHISHTYIFQWRNARTPTGRRNDSTSLLKTLLYVQGSCKIKAYELPASCVRNEQRMIKYGRRKIVCFNALLLAPPPGFSEPAFAPVATPNSGTNFITWAGLILFEQLFMSELPASQGEPLNYNKTLSQHQELSNELSSVAAQMASVLFSTKRIMQRVRTMSTSYSAVRA